MAARSAECGVRNAELAAVKAREVLGTEYLVLSTSRNGARVEMFGLVMSGGGGGPCATRERR
jgi:hypothetical protein